MALGRAGANIQLLSNKIYPGHQEAAGKDKVVESRAENRSIGEVVQSRRRPLLGPSPG